MLGIAMIVAVPPSILAGPQSTTYELKQYEFGGGGVQQTDSTSYSLFGIVGEQSEQGLDSTTYTLNAGFTNTLVANTPPAPTVTNPHFYYDRLHIALATGNNPEDATYAIQIKKTAETWSQGVYIQNDYTTAPTLGSEDWLLYSGAALTGWGGSSGFFVTGLSANTSYDVRVKARTGTFGESPWGPAGTVSTSVASLSFGVSASSIQFANLNSGNSYTDSSQSTVLTTSTNAYNGYTVFTHTTGPLTFLSNTIADYAGTNANPTAWSATGFGYSTNDSNLTGGTADRFTNGGAHYAGFTTSIPGDPVADRTTQTTTSEQFTVSYKVVASSATKAGTYKTTALYIVVPNY